MNGVVSIILTGFLKMDEPRPIGPLFSPTHSSVESFS